MPVMLFFSFLHQILQFHEFVRFVSFFAKFEEICETQVYGSKMAS